MPDFPKPSPIAPRFDHPPLCNLWAVIPEVHVRYDSWRGAFFPQIQDQLTAVVCALLTADGLSTFAAPPCPKLLVEVTIKALNSDQGVSGGVLVEVETYLQERCETARTPCKLLVISWAQRLHFWMSFRPRQPQDITLRIEGEVRRQVDMFLADWKRDNPTALPPPVCPPVLPAAPKGGAEVPPGPAAAPGDPGRLVGRWGVNVVHLELCSTTKKDFSNRNPGAVAEAPPELFRRLADRGAALFRLPIRWERLEPRFEETCTLEPSYLIKLKKMIDSATRVGGQVILDLHNSFRYFLDDGAGRAEWFVGEVDPHGRPPVPRSYLVRLWTRLSEEFMGSRTVVAYGIMNQPYPPTTSSSHYQWQAAAAEVVAAIRGTGDQKLILVDNDRRWSHADYWQETETKPWIADPRVIYEAHLEIQAGGNPLSQLKPFTEWCRANGVQGFLGSVALNLTIPDHRTLAAEFRAASSAQNLGWCYWPGDDVDVHNTGGLF